VRLSSIRHAMVPMLKMRSVTRSRLALSVTKLTLIVEFAPTYLTCPLLDDASFLSWTLRPTQLLTCPCLIYCWSIDYLQRIIQVEEIRPCMFIPPDKLGLQPFSAHTGNKIGRGEKSSVSATLHVLLTCQGTHPTDSKHVYRPKDTKGLQVLGQS
jgi:hypothetical protein